MHKSFCMNYVRASDGNSLQYPICLKSEPVLKRVKLLLALSIHLNGPGAEADNPLILLNN